jgi:hypothetical protein
MGVHVGGGLSMQLSASRVMDNERMQVGTGWDRRQGTWAAHGREAKRDKSRQDERKRGDGTMIVA